MKKIATLCLSLVIAMTAAADEWKHVTDASVLAAGDQIVLAYPDVDHSKFVVASKTLTKSGSTISYLEAVNATFSSDYGQLISLADNAAVFELRGDASAWELVVQGVSGDVYLGATAKKKLAWNASTRTWTIAITDGLAQVASTNTAYGRIQYFYNSGTPIFCNYEGSASTRDVRIYRLEKPASHALVYEGYPYAKTICGDPLFEVGSTVKLSNGKPVNGTKVFLGWDFEGTLLQPGASLVMPDKDVILQARWNNEESMQQTATRTKATKIFRDGQLFIVRDGKTYNALGVLVK